MSKKIVLCIALTVWLISGRGAWGAATPAELETLGEVIAITDDREARGGKEAYGAESSPGVPEDSSKRRSARMPDVMALSDTEWLIVYNEYSSAFSTGAWSRIVVKKTVDAGKTWQTQIVNEQQAEKKGYLGNWNMSRFGKLPDGRIAIASQVRGGSRNCYVFFSGDRGASWSGPINTKITDVIQKRLGIQAGYVECSRIEAMDDGTLLMMAHRGGQKPPQREPGRSYNVIDVFVSGDGGASWEYRSTVEDENHSVCEPAILLEGKTIQIYCRDDWYRKGDPWHPGAGMVVFRSEDEGRTWMKTDPGWTVYGHQPGLTKLRDGRVLVLYRYTDPCYNGCHIWVHDPKTFVGRTFRVHQLSRAQSRFYIDAGGAEQLPNGKILLCYSSIRRDDGVNWRYAEKRVRLAVMPPITEWWSLEMQNRK